MGTLTGREPRAGSEAQPEVESEAGQGHDCQPDRLLCSQPSAPESPQGVGWGGSRKSSGGEEQDPSLKSGPACVLWVSGQGPKLTGDLCGATAEMFWLSEHRLSPSQAGNGPCSLGPLGLGQRFKEEKDDPRW